MVVKVEFQNFKEMEALLGSLSRKLENKFLQNMVSDALRKAAMPVMKAAAPKHSGNQSKASKEYGTIVKNLKVKKTKAKKNGKGAKIDTGDAFWAYILEVGTRSTPAKPWFVPAFESAKNAILNQLIPSMKRAIEREAKRK